VTSLGCIILSIGVRRADLHILIATIMNNSFGNNRFGLGPLDGVKTASLTLSCTDQAGVIATIAKFFADREISLTRCSELVVGDTLLLRVQWELNDYWADQALFCKDFADTAVELKAEYDVKFCDRRHSIGLLVADETEVLLGILNKVQSNAFSGLDVAFIISSDQGVSKLADRYGLPFFYIEPSDGLIDHDRRLLDIVQRYKCDFLGLAQFPYQPKEELVEKCACPIVTTAPLDQFAGGGGDVYLEAHSKGAKLLGASSFLFASPASFSACESSNQALNLGAIVHQTASPVKNGSSISDLRKLGAELEQRVFLDTLTALVEHRVIQLGSKALVFD